MTELVFYGGIALPSIIAISYSEMIGRGYGKDFEPMDLVRLGGVIGMAYYVLYQEYVMLPKKTDDEQLAEVIARGMAMAEDEKKCN